MKLGQTEASALSRLFSAGILRDFGQHGRSALFTRLLEHTSVTPRARLDATVGDAFDDAFNLLKARGVRDDYVYRSAITQKVLLGRHSLRTATLLNEMRAGACKADVVVLNGTSTAYEIKSERDSLTRLSNQLDNYRKVFATVNVVVGATHLLEVLNATPDDVGVITLSNRFRLHWEREPQDRPDRTSPSTIFEVLRTEEACSVLRSIGLEVPSVPNTRIRHELGRIFADLDPTVAHEQMVRELKRSRSQVGLTDFISSIPVSLRAASLAAKPDSKRRIRIKQAVDTPLAEALTWK
jgi:hypothetical protein